MHCNLCGSTFGTRKNVWEEHIRTAKHLRLLRSKTAGDRRVTQTSLEQFAGTDAAAARQRGKIEMEHRVRVVRAVTYFKISHILALFVTFSFQAKHYIDRVIN